MRPESDGDRGSFRYKGQKGYLSDDHSGMLMLGARYYIPALGRFLTQDPIGHEGGLNLYAYCDNSPLLRMDPKGTDWDWGKYFGDVFQVLRGERDALGPVNMAKGAWGTASYLWQSGGSLDSFKNVGAGFIDGISFWNKSDPYAFGQAFMGFELAVAPMAKRIPNFTPLGLSSRFPLAGGGATLLRIDWAGQQIGRLDWHRIPATAIEYNKFERIAPWARGRSLPHIHKRGAGGIGRHRPYERMTNY